jgi:hypothetical protein
MMPASPPTLLPSWRGLDTTFGWPGRHILSRPKRVQSDCGHGMHCQLGLGCIDTEFIAPRSWELRRHWWERPYSTAVEHDDFLFADHFYRPAWRYTGNICQDYRHFYSRKSLGLLAIAVGGHAILANTSLDQDFRDSFQENAVGDPAAFDWAKVLGETWVVVPAALGLWAADEWIDRRGWFHHRGWNQDVGGWARQTCRALLVGAPANYDMQVGIGASRPTDTNGT